jgi:membrane-associated protease RseP (regulator of RpoE activity)
MIRIITTALLMAGVGVPGAPSQPAPQFNTAPEVFFYSSPGRSYLGVDIQDVTADRVGALKLKEERGVEVTMVDQDAPAGKAGLKEHDVILEFNGIAVEGEEQLRRLLREVPPGRTVTLGISRDGQPMKISVQLADRNKIYSQARPKVVIPRIPRIQIPRVDIPSYTFQLNERFSYSLGVQTENLRGQLAEYFGVKSGILVRSVEAGSAAEKAGLKAGDCIIRADNEKLSDQADLSHVLRSHPEGGKITLGIMRDKHEQTVVVELPSRSSGDSSWRIFDPEEMDGAWSEIEKELEELEPVIDHATDIAAAQAQTALGKARKQIEEAQPQIERATRQAAAEMRRAQRAFQQAQKEWRRGLSDLI